MAVTPSTIDIVVADMGKALAFYRTLGLESAAEDDHGPQANVYTPGGATLGFLTEALMRRADPHWVTPIGQRVTFACKCDSPAEVDATYAKVVAAGYTGLKAPWDSPWGQRYAMLKDPDGNRVDVYAAISEEGEEPS